MTFDERQALKEAVSQAKREKLRRSGGFESDEQRQEVLRLMRRRAEEAVAKDLRRLELERDALRVRCDALEAQRDKARRELRLAESWIQLAYGHTVVQDRPRRYATEEARIAARRATWREAKRRAKQRASGGREIAA